MRVGFLNDADDVQWLLETHLRGVILPTIWKGFQSFVLQGNEDSPHAVNLYAAREPNYTDDFYRVRFVNDSGAYAECLEYDGATDAPKGGFTPLI